MKLFTITLAFIVAMTSTVFANTCEKMMPSDLGTIYYDVYQAAGENKYFDFVVQNNEMFYHVVHARDISKKFTKTQNSIDLACLAAQFESYTQNDPFDDVVIQDMNAQSVVEVDHTIRSLAYVYMRHKDIIKSQNFEQYLLEKVEFLSKVFDENKHAIIYSNWHDLTKTVVAHATGTSNEPPVDDFIKTMAKLVYLLDTTAIDNNGAMANYYKQNLNSLVAMAELDPTLYDVKASNMTVVDVADKFLSLVAKTSQDLFVHVPDDFNASELPPEYVNEIADSLNRVRYEFDHRTHLGWLVTLYNKYQTVENKKAFETYVKEIREDYVNIFTI